MPILGRDRSNRSNRSTGRDRPMPSEKNTVKKELYKTELCRHYTLRERCPYKDKCQFAHGSDEIVDVVRHPKYKTELCKGYHTKGFCPYGSRCHFIHGDLDGAGPAADRWMVITVGATCDNGTQLLQQKKPNEVLEKSKRLLETSKNRRNQFQESSKEERSAFQESNRQQRPGTAEDLLSVWPSDFHEQLQEIEFLSLSDKRQEPFATWPNRFQEHLTKWPKIVQESGMKWPNSGQDSSRDMPSQCQEFHREWYDDEDQSEELPNHFQESAIPTQDLPPKLQYQFQESFIGWPKPDQELFKGNNNGKHQPAEELDKEFEKQSNFFQEQVLANPTDWSLGSSSSCSAHLIYHFTDINERLPFANKRPSLQPEIPFSLSQMEVESPELRCLPNTIPDLSPAVKAKCLHQSYPPIPTCPSQQQTQSLGISSLGNMNSIQNSLPSLDNASYLSLILELISQRLQSDVTVSQNLASNPSLNWKRLSEGGVLPRVPKSFTSRMFDNQNKDHGKPTLNPVSFVSSLRNGLNQNLFRPTPATYFI